jgi:hypothetical protein
MSNTHFKDSKIKRPGYVINLRKKVATAITWDSQSIYKRVYWKGMWTPLMKRYEHKRIFTDGVVVLAVKMMKQIERYNRKIEEEHLKYVRLTDNS